MSGSRFFAASDSESESSSDEEDLTIQTKSAATTKTFVWSDDEEDTKRVVKSEKEKRWEDMKNIIKIMRNHKKIKDMQCVQSDFEDLGRSFDKSKKVVEKEGIPRFFTRCIVELEDFVNECWEDRDWRKNISKSNAKGLTSLRQKLKRYNRDNNLEDELAKFRENPDVEEEDEKEESEHESEEEMDFKKPASEAPKTKASAASKEGDDDDDSDWPSESDSESSDDDETENLTAVYFLKKRPGEEEREKKDKKERRIKPVKQIAQEEDDQEGEEWQKVVGGGLSVSIQEKPKIFPKDTEITIEAVIKKLNEFITARGKKGTDRLQMIDMCIELRSIAAETKLGLALDVKLLFGVIGAIFDYNPNIATCMKADMWEKCVTHVRELLDLMVEHVKDLVVFANVTEDTETFEGEAPFRVRGSILNVVERMDEEYIKMLQSCDAHSTEYVDRLRDEPKVCKVIEDLQAHFEGGATDEEKCRVYLKRIEHLYYKFDLEAETGSLPLVDRLCKYIYDKDSTDRVRTRAMLCQVYHLAVHDKWYSARDLMLMSHLQDNIHAADIPTQIMYNRAMVQLGLCAFRQGMTKDAHNCLVDIQSSGRAKELLAQGLLLQRQAERTPEQEKIEKRRQMPFHMHINLELIECVYLVSAMLMEIPYMAAHEFDARRRMISKNFHHVLRVSDRQPLLGPPESMREHLVAASKAMKKGDWSACHNYIMNEKMNAKVWDLFQESVRVKEQLVEKIKVESLRTYLFTYSSVYDSISLDKLATMYELNREIVHSTISKMIINEELAASMDEPSQCAIMHRTDPSHLQSLALQLSEKVQSLVDYNEKLMEMKSGNFSFQRQGYQGGQGQQNQYQVPNRFQSQNRYGQNKQGGYQNKQGGYQQNKQGGYQQNKQGGYQQNKQGGGGYQQNRQGGYQQNRQGGYQNKQQGSYQQNRYQDRRVHFE